METITAPKKKALGKGLSALFADNDIDTNRDTQNIPLNKIKQSKLQPRTFFSETKLLELSASIREKGVLQPIIIRPRGNDYEIVIGERRWRAAIKAGLTEIPAIIRDFNDHDALECAIIENLQRDDLSAIETAHAYRRLMDEAGYSQEELSEKVGMNYITITNTLRLLKLPVRVQTMIDEGELTGGQARSLIGLPEAEKFAELIVKEQLSARQVEEMIRLYKQGKSSPILKLLEDDIAPATTVKETTQDDPAIIQKIETDFTKAFGLPVSLRPKGSGGRLTIRYNNIKDLEQLLGRLSGDSLHPYVLCRN